MSKHTDPVDVSHLAVFDTDGALRESAERVNHATRRGFLRTSGMVAAGGAAYALLPGSAWAATPKGDVAILNYALTLEYLESAFYDEANSKGALTGEYARFGKVVAAHEAAHVKALKAALGSAAVKKPKFDFQGTTSKQATFAATSIVLEDTGVKAYQGQAPNIKTPAILKAAISIHPVEARHASWIRNIAGQQPAPDAFNPAADMATILAAVKGTGFIPASGSASAGSGSAVSGTPAMTG
jgi:Ferritin-like domain